MYEDSSADPIDGTSWAAFQPWSGDSGYLFAFRQAGGPDTSTVAIHGVDRSRTYVLTDVRTGADLGAWSGAQLETGLPVTLAPFTAQAIAIEPR